MTTPTTVYDVPSATTPGTVYHVAVFADGTLDCDCPDSTYRRRQCKHQRRVIATRTAPALPILTKVRTA